MDYFLLLFIVVIFFIQTISFKEFNRSFMKNLGSYFLFNSIYFSLIVLLYLATNREFEALSPLTIHLGLMFGVLFFCAVLVYMKAMENGPLSYSSLLFSFGLLVPIIFGVFFWHEPVSPIQLVGLTLLLLTLLIGNRSAAGSDTQRLSMRWFIFAIAAMLGNGSLMTISKAQQMALTGQEIEEFLILAFGTSAMLSFLLFLYRHYRLKESVSHFRSRRLYLLVLVTGISTAVGNQIALYLTGRLPAIVQFPTLSGGIVIMATLYSVVVYRERLTRSNVTGLILGLVALVLLSLR